MTTHILHRAEVLAVAAGDNDEIEITFRSRADDAKVEKIGLRKTDVGLLIEALTIVRADPTRVVDLRKDAAS